MATLIQNPMSKQKEDPLNRQSGTNYQAGLGGSSNTTETQNQPFRNVSAIFDRGTSGQNTLGQLTNKVQGLGQAATANIAQQGTDYEKNEGDKYRTANPVLTKDDIASGVGAKVMYFDTGREGDAPVAAGVQTGQPVDANNFAKTKNVLNPSAYNPTVFNLQKPDTQDIDLTVNDAGSGAEAMLGDLATGRKYTSGMLGTDAEAFRRSGQTGLLQNVAGTQRQGVLDAIKGTEGLQTKVADKIKRTQQDDKLNVDRILADLGITITTANAPDQQGFDNQWVAANMPAQGFDPSKPVPQQPGMTGKEISGSDISTLNTIRQLRGEAGTVDQSLNDVSGPSAAAKSKVQQALAGPKSVTAPGVKQQPLGRTYVDRPSGTLGTDLRAELADYAKSLGGADVIIKLTTPEQIDTAKQAAAHPDQFENAVNDFKAQFAQPANQGGYKSLKDFVDIRRSQSPEELMKVQQQLGAASGTIQQALKVYMEQFDPKNFKPGLDRRNKTLGEITQELMAQQGKKSITQVSKPKTVTVKPMQKATPKAPVERDRGRGRG